MVSLEMFIVFVSAKLAFINDFIDEFYYHCLPHNMVQNEEMVVQCTVGQYWRIFFYKIFVCKLDEYYNV